MAKRFIDTALFDDEWFSELSQDSKIFWVYYITKCDHAGLLKNNRRLIEFQTGIKSLETVMEDFKGRIALVDGLFFCLKFIQFQYPNFPKSNVRQQSSAISLLVNAGIFNPETLDYTEKIKSLLTVSKDLNKSYVYVNDNDNDNEDDNVTELSNTKRAKNSKKFEPPDLIDFLNYAEENSPVEFWRIEDQVKLKFKAWTEADWYNGHGKKIKNWKTAILNTLPHFKPINNNGISQTNTTRTSKIGSMPINEVAEFLSRDRSEYLTGTPNGNG